MGLRHKLKWLNLELREGIGDRTHFNKTWACVLTAGLSDRGMRLLQEVKAEVEEEAEGETLILLERPVDMDGDVIPEVLKETMQGILEHSTSTERIIMGFHPGTGLLVQLSEEFSSGPERTLFTEILKESMLRVAKGFYRIILAGPEGLPEIIEGQVDAQSISEDHCKQIKGILDQQDMDVNDIIKAIQSLR